MTKSNAYTVSGDKDGILLSVPKEAWVMDTATHVCYSVPHAAWALMLATAQAYSTSVPSITARPNPSVIEGEFLNVPSTPRNRTRRKPKD